MTELLPCPFCGGEASIGRRDYCFEDSNEYAMSAHYVECSTCYVRTIEYKSKDGAADAWNRRAERTCRNVHHAPEFLFKCSECGAKAYPDGMLKEQVTYCPRCGARVVGTDDR